MRNSPSKIVPLLALVAILATGCLGPRPQVSSFTTEPPPKGSGQPYKVTATILNEGPGEGEVVVQVDLTNKQDGSLLAREEKKVQMQGGEKLPVVVEVDLPPEAENLDPSAIEVQVDAQYPVE